MARFIELWGRLPSGIQDAILTGVVVNALTFVAAVKMWLNARFFKAAHANVVEGIHLNECSECAELARAANVKDGIEDKAKPIVLQIKTALDAAKAKAAQGGPDAPKP